MLDSPFKPNDIIMNIMMCYDSLICLIDKLMARKLVTVLK